MVNTSDMTCYIEVMNKEDRLTYFEKWEVD